MTISPEELLRIARLAELEVSPGELDRLASEVDRIVGYVGQLSAVPLEEGGEFLPGPAEAALRPDRIDPIPLTRPIGEIAPELSGGLFLVPRLTGMEDG